MINIKIAVTIPNVSMYIRIASVRLLSIVSTSLEKRLVMRPSGVVSKNDIGALSVRVMALLSITLLDFVPRIVNETENPNIKRACKAPKEA